MLAELRINRIWLLDSLGINHVLTTQLKYVFYFYLLANFKLFAENKDIFSVMMELTLF
jgi:hypothetical protein